jgi:hypothetical protein
MDEEKNKKVPIDMKRDASKQELLLALIQHGSRPAGWVLISLIVLIAVLWVREPLFRVIGSAKELRLGNYVYLKAERAGVSSELKKLATLTTDQIQLFLIIGRSRPGHHITYGGPESNEESNTSPGKAGGFQSREPLEAVFSKESLTTTSGGHPSDRSDS